MQYSILYTVQYTRILYTVQHTSILYNVQYTNILYTEQYSTQIFCTMCSTQEYCTVYSVHYGQTSLVRTPAETIVRYLITVATMYLAIAASSNYTWP